MAVEKLRFEFDGDASKFQSAVNKSQKSVNNFSTSLKQVGGIIAGAFAIDKLMEFGSSVIETTSTFQRFESVLTNTLGSESEAQKALDRITDFASKTPFSVSELTDSFVRLANQGFKPTSEEMRKLGDLASSTGKEFVMLAEAIIDAQVGEFERLKEFGIRAEKQGDQVTFTFKNVKTQVDFTSDAIQNYILSLGDLKGVSGAMVGISNTLGGQISNLGDSFDKMKDTIGDKLMPVLTSVINKFKGLFEIVTDFLNPNQALIDDFREAKVAVDNIEQASLVLSQTQRKLIDIANERKRQRLAELENEISKETENLTSKVQRQSQVLDIENKKLKDLGDLLIRLQSNQNTTSKNLEYQTDRFIKQKKVVDEVQDQFNSLNKELSVFKTKVQEIQNPTKDLSEITKETTLQSTNLTNTLKHQGVELSTKLSEAFDTANLKTRELATTSEETGSAFGVLADGMQQIGISVGLAFARMAMEGEKSIGEIINSLAKMIVQMTVALVIATALRSIFDPSAPAVTAKNLAVAGAVVAGAGILSLATKPKEFAHGGIVTKPTMGIVGEAGQSEAIIPLNRLPQLMGTMGSNQRGEFTLRGQDLILALERAGDFRTRVTG